MYRSLAILLASLTLVSNNAEAGEANLSWTPPIQNTDGTPLTNLVSYDIHSGCNSTGIYDRPVEVTPAPASSYTVLNLPDFGTCYFAVKAANSSGVLSAFSNEATKVLGAVPPDSDSINVTWAESQTLIISNTLPSTYRWGVLELGELIYTNRSYVFTEIPIELIGLDYLQTSNSDKRGTDPNTISFDVSRPVTVFVALDRRILPIPSWLNSWVVTGEIITKSPRDSRFNLYSKDFPAGAVILGGNEGDGPSMYIVVID